MTLNGFKKNSENSIYSEIFSSFFRITAILIFVLLFISYIIINFITIRSRSLQAVRQTENICSNITYMIQDDIIMCNALATNDTLKQSLKSFVSESPSRKVDIDSEIASLFESYYYVNEEIQSIRVFFPLSEKPDTIGFKSVAYLDTYNSEDWTKYFTPGASAISAEYSCDPSYNSYFEKDSDCMSLIVPIMTNKTDCLGFVCMDIRKDRLLSKAAGGAVNAVSPVFIVNNKGTVISDSSPLGDDFEIDGKISYSSASGYTTARYKGSKYLLAYSTTGRHGWKIMQIMPYSTVSSLALPTLLIFLLLMLVFFMIAISYSQKKSAALAHPLQKLSDAMETSAPINGEGGMAAELKSVYDSYNRLLDNNKLLISETEKNFEKQRRNETKMLLAQISPHFLYNTLNSIAWKAINADQPEICSVVSKLAKLFKLSYSFTSEFTTLAQELTHIQLYLELQKECFSNKFDYKITVPDEFSEFQMPRFILQPLVENAIIHGFSQLNSDIKGCVSVSADADEVLTVTVNDNGSGIDKDILLKLNNDSYFSEKYGIHNINRRIKLLCGEEYGIQFRSNGHSKTSAVITLPIVISPQKEQ